MNPVNQTERLHALIHTLEERRVVEFNALKAQLRLAGESLKPVNLVKSAAHELTENKTLRSYLLQAGIGLAISLLTKNLISGARANKSAKVVANIAEVGLNKLSANQVALIKIAAPLVIGFIVDAIKSKRKKSKKKNIVTE